MESDGFDNRVASQFQNFRPGLYLHAQNIRVENGVPVEDCNNVQYDLNFGISWGGREQSAISSQVVSEMTS